METQSDIRTLIDRLARLADAEDWGDDLNPSQRSVLRYLARANQYSRAPSQVAEYLGTTRGTISQTLHVLVRKGMVIEQRSDVDRRRISYALTERGLAAAAAQHRMDQVLAGLPDPQAAALRDGLAEVLGGLIRQRGGRPFGLCRTCRHHQATGTGGHCRLLNLALLPDEVDLMCHEQEAA